MTIEIVLRKLEPLIPQRVRRWRQSLDLVDSDLRSLLEKEILHAAYKRLGDFRRKPLLSLPPSERASGDLHLGTVLYDADRWPAGLDTSELMQHVAIFGRSGAGKTNVALHLLRQLVAKATPFIVLDWKRSFRHLLPDFQGKVRLYTPGRQLSPFPFSPFIAPPQLEHSVYLQQVVDVLGDAYTLGDAARNILLKALATCHDDGLTAPNSKDVIDRVEALPDKERVRGWKVSAIRALEALGNIPFAASEASQRSMVTLLADGQSVVELDGLSPSNRKALIPLMCLWLYYLKLPTRDRERLTLVVVIEEAHQVLYPRQAGRESLLSGLWRQCREIGIGMMAIDQHPAKIDRTVLGNSYASICMNLKDPRDVNQAAAISLLENEDKRFLGTLPTGVGIVKLQDRWRSPFLVRFPLVPVAKGSVDDSAALAYAGSGTRSALSESIRPRHNQSPLDRQLLNEDGGLQAEDVRFLKDVVEHPSDGVDSRYKRLGISVEKGNRTKADLVRWGFLDQEQVPFGRTRRVLLRITGKARQSLGFPKRDGTSESMLHEYWKHWYAEAFRSAGYTVNLEVPRSRGAVDVLATKASETVAVEVETGKSDVVWNVSQDLLSRFTQVIVVATDNDAFHRVEEELARAGVLTERVRVALREAGAPDPTRPN